MSLKELNLSDASESPVQASLDSSRDGMVKPEETLENIIEGASRLTWRQRQRYITVLLAFFSLMIMYLVRYPLTHAMTHIKEIYGYDQVQDGWIKGAFFVGYIPGQPIGGHLSRKYGGKYVNLIGLLVSCAACAIMPVSAGSFALLFLLRIVTGLGQGLMYPAIIDLFKLWVLPRERTLLLNFAYSGAQIGTILQFSLSPYLISAHGWQSGFYIFSVTGIVWAIFWVLFVHNHPMTHPFLSSEERAVLVAYEAYNLDRHKDDRSREIPYWAIFTSGPVYVFALVSFSFNWSFYLFMDSIAKYCEPVLGSEIPIHKSLITSIPYMVFLVILLATGFFSDYLIRSSVRLSIIRRSLVLLGFIPCAILLLCIPVYSSAMDAYISIVFAVGISGISQCGYTSNSIELSPEFAPVIIGIVNVFGSSAGLIVPAITGAIQYYGKCTDHYPEPQTCISAWSVIFTVSACIYLLGAVIWLFFSRFHRLDFPKERTLRAFCYKLGICKQPPSPVPSDNGPREIKLGP